MESPNFRSGGPVPSPLGGAPLTTPPRFNAGGAGFSAGTGTSAGSSGKGKAKASPNRSSRRDRREKWQGRIGHAAASPRSARQQQLASPSSSSRASPGAASAGNTFNNSTSASRPFGLPSGGIAGTPTAPPTAVAAAVAGYSASQSRTVATSTTSPYNMRQLLQSLTISTSATATSEIPRPSPDSSLGSSASDKENGSSSSPGTGITRFGPSSAVTSAAAGNSNSNSNPNSAVTADPYALPNGPKLIDDLINDLPRALNLDGELDDVCIREMAEAIMRCQIRKRPAPSSTTMEEEEEAQQPKRAEMSPARAAAHAAASARKEKQSQQSQGQQKADSGADSDSSWVDVDGARDAGAAAASTAAAAEELSFRTACLAFETADTTAAASAATVTATATTSGSSATVNKEAQFLGRMKIDDDEDDHDNGAASWVTNSNARSPEGIVASRVQRLGLDGSGKKKNDGTASSSTNTTTATPVSKQPKPFGIPAAASAASRSNPNATPTTKATAMLSTPTATVANDASATPGTASKFSNLKGMWEGFSSPDPAAAAAAAKAARENTETEGKGEDMDAAETDEGVPTTPAVNLTGPAAAEARAKEAFAKANATESQGVKDASAAAATPASNTDEHGFPDAAFPSPNSDDSFDLDSGLDEQGLPEMSFFHSPAEKVNAFSASYDPSASVFAFDPPPPATPEEQQSQENGSKIKPLKKPPHTNAKQGKMRRKVAPSADADVGTASAVGVGTTVGEGIGGVGQNSFQFSVDLSKGKDGGARKQGKSKGQRASMVAPQISAEKDVEMAGTSPTTSRPSSSDEALAAAAAAAAAAANVDPSLKQDFSIGASPRKSPRARGGRKSKNKLPGFGTKPEAKPLASSMFRGGVNTTVDASFDSTSGPMPFLDPFASAPAPPPAPVEAAPKPSSVPASAPSEGQAAHIAALRDEGRELYLERRYQESVVRYSSALRIRTCNFTVTPRLGQNDLLLAQILGNRAAALLMVGAYDAAASDCRKGLEQIPDAAVWDLKADSGPALRSRLLGRMGRALLKAGKVDAAEEAFDATIRIADETFVRYGRDNVDPKAVNLLDQSIADATLNKTDARRLRVEKSEINKYCSGLPPNVAALRHGAQIIAHVKTALELAPGDVELHSHTVQLFAYMKRWADLALHCERFASDCVKFDGVFVDDLSSLNPYPSAPLAQTLKGDHFDLSALDAATNAPKLLSEEAVGEAVRRMPMSMLPLYLRALRLEERYAEAQRAASILLASAREGNLAGCPITLLEREQKKRIRTCTIKDTGDALFRKGQYEEAAAKYGACLLVDAEGEDIATADGSNAGGRLHAVLHCNRAACFMASKQYREAAKECTAALHIHTLYMKAMLRRARCHSRLQRHEEAVSEYQHWISLAEAAARNPQSAAAEYAAACYFDKPSDTTPDDIEKARVELNEAVKAKNSQAEAEANARARAQRQKWYDDNLRSGGVGGDSSGATSDAHRRKQQWYESAGNDGSRRWDSFNGSSPKKPGGNTGRSYSHHRSPPRAQYQQQQQRSQSYRQQQSEASAPIEGNPKGRTHYEVLGISRNATVAQIKKAYRKMALKYHPDKGGSDEDFLPVQQAYDTLSDESSRRKYDNDLRYSRF